MLCIILLFLFSSLFNDLKYCIFKVELYAFYCVFFVVVNKSNIIIETKHKKKLWRIYFVVLFFLLFVAVEIGTLHTNNNIVSPISLHIINTLKYYSLFKCIVQTKHSFVFVFCVFASFDFFLLLFAFAHNTLYKDSWSRILFL